MPGRSKRSAESVVCHTFQHGDYIYNMLRPLIVHPDYDTMLIALRSHAGSSGAPQAVVLKAVDKYLPEHASKRMYEEARLARYLDHPRIASVLGIVYDDDQPYIAMQYIPGCFLASAIAAAVMLGRKLSPQAAAYVAAEVAEVLDYAHHCKDGTGQPLGIIHRAVSPVSVRLDSRGGVRLMNFGAAWCELRGRIDTPDRTLRGNPAYVAPEIVRSVVYGKGRRTHKPGGQPDKRADIFSLGLVLLETLIATHPLDSADKHWPTGEAQLPSDFRSEHGAFMPAKQLANRVLHFGPEQVKENTQDVPEPLRPIIARALRLAPDERYQSAAELQSDLLNYLSSCGAPYGSRELEAEVGALLKEATDHHFFVVSGGIERGLLRDSPVFRRKG